MGCVEDLARIVGLDYKVREEFDWAAIEASLGLALPDDYKEIVEHLPDGRFQGFVRVIRPGDDNHPKSTYLGYYGYRLEDMRKWRADEPSRFPYPIYPEPGGLLPWGTSNRAGLFFWLTEGRDSAAWPIVVAHPEFIHWTTPYQGTICDFLKQVVLGRFDASPFVVDLPPGQSPWFEPRPQAAPATSQPTTNADFFLSRKSWSGGQPVSRLDELEKHLGAPSHPVTPIQWEHVEGQIGLPLPSDYKAFIDSYGPGTFCDITIAAPAAPADLDLLTLINRKYRQATGNPRRRVLAPPIHPEPGGMIPWGETPDGWTCCWAPTDHNPDDWGIVLADVNLRPVEYVPDMSFSALLVQYATPGAPPVFGLLGKPNPEVYSFIPYRP
jgi:hypothetical protein